ncbi:MAG: GNAT family N-acetyltransferase [Acidimicrobiia bacterium]|nr:GNAT family N-acetyltransferase [Acidimicrobiia bacterium]
MIIRRELPADAGAVRDLFGSVYTESFFDRVHADPARITEMSFVALVENEEVVGHVAASRGTLDTTSVLALVPPSVNSAHRGHGVGQALMHTVLGAAEAAGEPLVGVVATPPEWFSQFGFAPGGEYSIKPSVGGSSGCPPSPPNTDSSLTAPPVDLVRRRHPVPPQAARSHRIGRVESPGHRRSHHSHRLPRRGRIRPARWSAGVDELTGSVGDQFGNAADRHRVPLHPFL